MSDVADLVDLDRAHASIMDQVVATGTAPHYLELARSLDVSNGLARDLVHDLVAIIPGWVHLGTDLIASFPPFNPMPTQYLVSIDGERRWFAQCGFEALAIRWLVPGRTVRADAPSLCCGEPMTVEMVDDTIVSTDPETIVATRAALWVETSTADRSGERV